MSGPELAWAAVTIVAAAGLWARAELQLRRAKKASAAVFAREAHLGAVLGDLEVLAQRIRSEAEVLLEGARAVNTETGLMLAQVLAVHRAAGGASEQ